jgi:hypothetical protein
MDAMNATYIARCQDVDGPGTAGSWARPKVNVKVLQKIYIGNASASQVPEFAGESSEFRAWLFNADGLPANVCGCSVAFTWFIVSFTQHSAPLPLNLPAIIGSSDVSF